MALNLPSISILERSSLPSSRRLSAICLAILATAIVWHFHDRNWWAPDDGAYAHIAERLLNGEVLNGSIFDHHLGLVHFVHAAAFKVFGISMVGLRYPLALLTVVQSLIVFQLFQNRDYWTALAGGIAMVALTFVQFLDPSANWYALFATVLLIAVTTRIPREASFRYIVLGALVMLVSMFRQLTGGLVAIGLVAYLLCEDANGSGSGRPVLARVALALSGITLALYFLAAANPLAFVLFGIWPLGLIAAGFFNCTMSDRAAARLLAHLALGGAIAIAPLLLYHLYHGSLMSWLDDTVVTAFSLVDLPFMHQASYGTLLLAVGVAISKDINPVSMINGAFWIALLAAPVILGATAVRRSWSEGRPVPLLAHMAVFFAIVSLHYETPIYLLHTTAMTLCGLLALTAVWPKRVQCALAVGVLAISGSGLWWQAGQPFTRSLLEIASGEDIPLDERPLGFRVDLRVAPKERAFYEWLVPLILRNSGTKDSILALPVNPELYFMTGRRNPTRFHNSALGLRTDKEVENLLSTLAVDPPAVVIFNRRDKYVTPNTLKVMARVRQTYRLIASRDGFEVYSRPR